MSDLIQVFITVVLAVVGSTGFWAYLQRRHDRRSNSTKLLLGLAHDRLMHLGMNYIERGSITRDEFENLHDYIWRPYHDEGGNGTGDRVMSEVKKLPIKN